MALDSFISTYRTHEWPGLSFLSFICEKSVLNWDSVASDLTCNRYYDDTMCAVIVIFLLLLCCCVVTMCDCFSQKPVSTRSETFKIAKIDNNIFLTEKTKRVDKYWDLCIVLCCVKTSKIKMVMAVQANSAQMLQHTLQPPHGAGLAGCGGSALPGSNYILNIPLSNQSMEPMSGKSAV